MRQLKAAAEAAVSADQQAEQEAEQAETAPTSVERLCICTTNYLFSLLSDDSTEVTEHGTSGRRKTLLPLHQKEPL